MSRRHPGVLWTHNDSGGDDVLFAVTARGDVLGEFTVRGARNRDWEDLALGPCLTPVRDRDCLYIADTGDNDRRRNAVEIYVVPEPIPPDTTSTSEEPVRGRTERAVRIRLNYLRGPDDVEALAVSPAGDAVLVGKGRGGRVDMYEMDRRTMQIAAETGRPVTLRSTGTLAIGGRSLRDLVTGAAFSPSGALLVVRTYRDLFFYERADRGWALAAPPCRLRASEPQGEAVDFVDEEVLVLASEAVGNFPATIYRVRCQPGG